MEVGQTSTKIELDKGGEWEKRKVLTCPQLHCRGPGLLLSAPPPLSSVDLLPFPLLLLKEDRKLLVKEKGLLVIILKRSDSWKI